MDGWSYPDRVSDGWLSFFLPYNALTVGKNHPLTAAGDAALAQADAFIPPGLLAQERHRRVVAIYLVVPSMFHATSVKRSVREITSRDTPNRRARAACVTPPAA